MPATTAHPDTAPAPPGRARRVAAPVGTAGGLLLVWAGVALLRPGDAGPTPCLWRTTTGLDCPFCGSTRAAACLAHGDVIAALDHNALFVVGVVPTALVLWALWLRSAWRGGAGVRISTRAMVVALVVIGLWWVVRLLVPWLGSAAG